MGGLQHKRKGIWDSTSGEAAWVIKKQVLLDMKYLVNFVMREIKGPEMDWHIYPSDEGLSSVAICFDVRKLEMQIKDGSPDQEVVFVCAKSRCVEMSEHNAVMKLAGYLRQKFHVQIEDWNYQKLCLTEKKLLELDYSIKVRIANINDLVSKWKSSVGLRTKMQSVITLGQNNLYNAASGKLRTIKGMVEATLEHISDWMSDTHNEYAQYCQGINPTDLSQDVTTIKIPEIEMFRDIILSLGLKQPKFSHTFAENDMFRGICKFKCLRTAASKHFAKTIIEGELKKSAYEAEHSAAAESIRYLERFMDLEVVDLSLPILLEKEECVELFQSVEKNYVCIEQYVLAKWRAMVGEVKGLFGSQYSLCHQMDLDVDEHDSIDCADIIEESLSDMSLLLDFSTIGLEQFEA